MVLFRANKTRSKEPFPIQSEDDPLKLPLTNLNLAEKQKKKFMNQVYGWNYLDFKSGGRHAFFMKLLCHCLWLMLMMN